MDKGELVRLLLVIRKHTDGGKVKFARTQDQINDIADRHVQSLWSVLSSKPINLIEFPATKEAAKEHVVGCTTITFPERLTEPDNRICMCGWGCGRLVQYRPYVPDHVTKACLYCVAERLEHGDQ